MVKVLDHLNGRPHSPDMPAHRSPPWQSLPSDASALSLPTVKAYLASVPPRAPCGTMRELVITISLADLEAAGACDSGLAYYREARDAAGRGPRPLRIVWSALAYVWLATSAPGYCDWLVRAGVLPRWDLQGYNLSGANLRGANLSGADLRGADLSGADLSRADLSWANLRGADLSWANLRGANLSRADLSWANLRGADLSGADLSGADLSGADLSGANLSGANLRGADLSGANLSRAYLRGADLSGANLSRAYRPTGEIPEGYTRSESGHLTKTH